jgi:TFIIF-interacting CTD phosphatase-like protein
LLLILDIDETLVHVVRAHENIQHKHTFKVHRTGFPPVNINFNLRPGVREFLTAMRDICHIALMTASHKSYADQVNQFLDPKKEIFKAVFSKEHCVNYTKGR